MSIKFENFGKYVLLEKLATGGMAEVFLARGTGAGGIGKFFAIKRILPQYADSPEFIEMFKDEAKIAINLNHSNIVSIHEFGVEKGQFFLVMDYVEGRNLRQILNKMKKTNQQFTLDQIVFVIKEVAAGLDHAHRCIDGSTGKPLNITHRDMSPQNLMVSFEGEVKIVDFGIAKAESQIETTRAGTLKGKFGYMSPEQAEGQPVDLRTDIFSLGIVMWELLANDRLFVANNEINTLRKIRDCHIPSLRKINPNIQAELERIVQKGLARDRNLRYQTGAALHRDLNRFLNRQYPDFSPQDFSVFTKSVFADEILSLRKRLVEYSQVNLNSNAPSKGFEAASLLDPTTSSLVVASDSSISPTVTGNSDANISDTTHSTTSDLPSIEVSKGKITPPASSIHNLPTTVQHNPLVLDDGALAAEMERELSVRGKSPVQLDNDGENSSTSISRTFKTRRTSRDLLPPREPAPSMHFASFLIFAILSLSLYAYLVKYFTPMMSGVIAVTDPLPFMQELHAALGVELRQPMNSLEVSSNRDPVMPPVVEPPVAPTPSPTTTPTTTVTKPVAEEATAALVVISNPSGAEIWIDQKNTGLTTPGRVEVPTVPFTITLRKHGYADSRQRDVTIERLGHRFTANLVKMNVAYINIEVFPPQEATISINGKPLPRQNGYIHEMPVTANTNLVIRAESKGGLAYDEVTVNLPVDRRQTIQLNPRKPLRIPSNSPNQ